MGIFKKNKETKNEFAEVQSISNGNLYDVKQKLEAQRQIDLNNLEKINFNHYFSDFEIQDYYLLQLQANYFVNVIKFDIDDASIFSKIKQMIRCAFINGKAALYFDSLTKEWRVYYINQEHTNRYGETIYINATPYNLIQGISTPEALKNHDKLREDLKDNYIIFKWGSLGLSCWLYIWPFIKFQNTLLSMIQSDSFSYIKKFIMDIADPSQVDKELRDWFNPKNPFIKKPKNIDISNKFKSVEVGSHSIGKDVVNMYKDICGVYYSIFGRRWNNDFKKERSITNESELTASNYDVLEKDWLDEFKIFMKQFNNMSKVKITLVEDVFNEKGEDDVI